MCNMLVYIPGQSLLMYFTKQNNGQRVNNACALFVS